MTFRPLRALVKALTAISTPLAVAACAHTPSINPIPIAFRCAALIPDSDRQPVAPTPLPSPEATAGALWIALDDQTARLDLANGRAADGLSILQRCEDERARAAAPAPRGLSRFWPF